MVHREGLDHPYQRLVMVRRQQAVSLWAGGTSAVAVVGLYYSASGEGTGVIN